MLRVDGSVPDDVVDIARSAAARCGVRLTISDASTESEDALALHLPGIGAERVRSLVPVSAELRLALMQQTVGLDMAPVSGHGRIELPRWLKEQAISETTHRYGRLTPSVFDARV